MCVTPMGKPMCGSFEEYEEVTELVPLNFMEDDVTWVASKLTGSIGALGADVIELRNWLIRF